MIAGLRRWWRKPFDRSRAMACDVSVETANAIGAILDTRASLFEEKDEKFVAAIYRDAADRARVCGTEIAEHVRNGAPL